MTSSLSKLNLKPTDRDIREFAYGPKVELLLSFRSNITPVYITYTELQALAEEARVIKADKLLKGRNYELETKNGLSR